MAVELTPTATCPAPLEAMRAAGWTDAQLIEHGFATRPASPVEEIPPVFVVASDGKKFPVEFPPAVDNPFGVVKLEQVAHIYRAVAPVRNFPGGYSDMQHILLVANELYRRAKRDGR